MNRLALMAGLALLLIAARHSCLVLHPYGVPVAIPVPWLALGAYLLVLAGLGWLLARSLLSWPHLLAAKAVAR